MRSFDTKELVVVAAATLAAGAGVCTYLHADPVLTFSTGVVGLGAIASVVGDATEHLGDHVSPGTTGVIQAALGNLPELLVGVFSLHAGLIDVVKGALVGSILAILVLGLAFVVGGLKHGPQQFSTTAPRAGATLMLMAVAALVVPSLAQFTRSPASHHTEALSVACAVIC